MRRGARSLGAGPLRAGARRPAGPAKAWAMSSHRSASGPSASTARSARWARWVTSRQKSRRGPGDPLRRRPRARTPTTRRPGRCSSTRNSSAGGGQSAHARRRSRGSRTPIRATCRSRSVGGRTHAERVGDVLAVGPGLHEPGGGHGGDGSSAGRTRGTGRRRAPCAQRAVAGPARPSRQSREQLVGRQRGALLGALVHERVPGAASAFSTSRGEGVRVGDGEQGRAGRSRRGGRSGGRRSSRAAGVASAHCSGLNSATSRSSSSLSARRSSRTGVGSAMGRAWQRAQKQASMLALICF